MSKYEVEYEYCEKIWDTTTVEAEDKAEAEMEALNYIHDTFLDAIDVKIGEIKEIG